MKSDRETGDLEASGGSGDAVRVIKLNPDGSVALEYAGRLLSRTSSAVVLEAVFGPVRRELGYVTLEAGDRFVEHFYTDRWYNVFVIYAGGGSTLKGWYCNITRPAAFVEAPGQPLAVEAVDLALDYFVQPSGQGFVLDEDEFAALGLPPADVAAAERALDELRRLAAERSGPFANQP